MSKFVKIVSCKHSYYWYSDFVGTIVSLLHEVGDECYILIKTSLGNRSGWADKKDVVECDEHGNLVVIPNEENKMEWRNIKVRIDSPEMSRAFQEEAFKNGCEWYCAGTVVSYVKEKFLFIDNNGDITWDDDQDNYENKPYKEVIVETTYKFSLGEETFEFNGKTYNKAKFLNAIKGLEQ